MTDERFKNVLSESVPALKSQDEFILDLCEFFKIFPVGDCGKESFLLFLGLENLEEVE